MKPVAFEYVQTTSVNQTLELLTDRGGAKLLAGGQSLVPLMNFRLNRPELVVDINNLVPELGQVIDNGSVLKVGALVRHHELLTNPLIQDRVPVLAEAARHIGHWAIRQRGTIGGSVVHADPAAELPAVLVALSATIVAQSQRGERRISAEEFLMGYYTTVLDSDELVLAIECPIALSHLGFYEVVRRPGDFALAGAVAEIKDGNAFLTWFGIESRPRRLKVGLWPDGFDEQRELIRATLENLELSPHDHEKRALAFTVGLRSLESVREAD